MNIIKPKSLKAGDTISIIAPSGQPVIGKVLRGKDYLESKGYKVKLGKHLEQADRYLSASDDNRLEDLHEAFSDEDTNAIICARGGYGALRLIDKIDYELIRNNPKIFCGYSDITILNAFFYKKSGLITFSAPMIQGDFAQECIDEFTEQKFFSTLQDNSFELNSFNYESYGNIDKAEGILYGGNLSTLASLAGTDFIPDEKFMLFAEDLNEPVYKIDRYFTQLFNIQKFRDKISALILGDFIGIEEEYKKDLDALFAEIAKWHNIPVIKTFPISHSKQKGTIPVGAFAHLDNGLISAKNYLTI